MCYTKVVVYVILKRQWTTITETQLKRKEIVSSITLQTLYSKFMITLLTLQLTIFILVAVGFLMKKIHIIGPQGQKNINDLVIYLILPCNILHAFTQSAADGDFTNYLEILLISIGIQVFCVIYGKLMFRGEAEGRYKCLQ